MVQEVVLSRSLKPSRRSPSSSFYSASESQLLLLNRLNHLFPTLFWRLLCRRLHLVTSLQDVSTQTSDHSDTLSSDVAVQTSFFGALTLSLDAAAQTITPSTLSQHVSTQMGPRSASSFSVDASVQITAHSAVLIDAATQLNLTEFLLGWIYSDRPLDRRHPFCQSPPSILGAHVAPLPPPGLEQPAPPPVIATQPQSLTKCHPLSYFAAHC